MLVNIQNTAKATCSGKTYFCMTLIDRSGQGSRLRHHNRHYLRMTGMENMEFVFFSFEEHP